MPLRHSADEPASRRTFLRRSGAAMAGLIVVGAGCGGDQQTGEDPAGSTNGDEVFGDDLGPGPILLRNVFPDGLAQGQTIIADTGMQRAVFALTQDSIVLDADRAPREIVGELSTSSGATQTVTLVRRDDQVPRPFFAMEFQPVAAELHSLTIEVEGEQVTTQFVVAPIADVPLVHPGEPMLAVETPTTAAPRGVDPLCTRDPVCLFHRMSVHEALEAGLPFVLMVSSPAFCTTGVCGPNLEMLIAAVADRPDLTVIHAEVYTDPSALGSQPRDTLLAPVLTSLGMSFEPSLITVDSDGIVQRRLDTSMDAGEIAAAVNAI